MISGHNSTEASVTNIDALKDLLDEYEPTGNAHLAVNDGEDTGALHFNGDTSFATEKIDGEREFMEALAENHLTHETLVIRSFSVELGELPYAWQWIAYPNGDVEYESLELPN